MSAVPYPMPVIIRARELRDAGWTVREVRDFVAQETGCQPSINTVWKWVDPEYRARENARKRADRLRESMSGGSTGGRLGSARHSRAYQEARARMLAEAGVLHSQVAKVMAFDFPDGGWTEHRVRKLLGPKQRMAVAA